MRRSRRKDGILVEFQPMSPEEIERTVQFLLRQQAQFVADFEKLSSTTDRIADGIIGLTGIVGHLADGLVQLTQRVDQLAQRTEEHFRQTDDHLNTVESHLDVVIQMFERHLREDHGHQPS